MPEIAGAVAYAHRHDPTHPLWRVLGPDPRDYDPAQAQALLDVVVTWIRTRVVQALPPTS